MGRAHRHIPFYVASRPVNWSSAVGASHVMSCASCSLQHGRTRASLFTANASKNLRV